LYDGQSKMVDIGFRNVKHLKHKNKQEDNVGSRYNSNFSYVLCRRILKHQSNSIQEVELRMDLFKTHVRQKVSDNYRSVVG